MTGADALRIERSGRDFWSFAARWSDPDGSIAGRYAPHLFFADTGQEPFVLGLLHNESSLHAGTTKCSFLGETPPTEDAPLGVGRCALYEGRPAACRVFPSKLDATRELVQLEPLPTRGQIDDPNPIYSLCPTDWKPEHIDPIETPGVIAAAEIEMEFFHKIARMWNRVAGPWEAFPKFLRLVYAGRVRVVEPVADPVVDESDELVSVPFRRAA